MQSHLLEKAEKVVNNPQILVNIISRRVRQLSNGHRPLVEVLPRMGLSDIALTEVIEGKITYEATVGFKEEPIVQRDNQSSRSSYESRAA